MLARLPVGIEGLAVVLYISQARGSFAVAGLVSGGFALGAAIGAPLQSRLIDRMGQRAVLVPAALGNAAAVGALIALTELGAPAGRARGDRAWSAACRRANISSASARSGRRCSTGATTWCPPRSRWTPWRWSCCSRSAR